MPLNVIAGLLFVLAALVLYSLGVWGAFRRKGASKRDLVLLWIGFACDVLATSMMSVQATAKVAAAAAGSYIKQIPLGATTLVLQNDLKTYLALIAMVLMLAMIASATVGFVRANAKMAKMVSRTIVAPWALWVVVFIMGLASSMPKR
jgi:hypothetical protein